MKIIIKNLRKKIPFSPKRIKKAILNVLSSEGIRKSGEITVSFVSDTKIKELNLRYLGKNNPTDVLSFNLTDSCDSRHIFADIIISVDTVIRNSRIFKTRPLYELNLCVIHGILHLLGYNDRTSKQKQLMLKKEREYVNRQN